MTNVKKIVLPKDERGNDPNDFRDEPDFREKIKNETSTDVIARRPADMRWLDDYTLTEAEVEQLVDPEWIYKDLIIKSHIIAFPAAPGAGKTTILMHIAGLIAEQGDYEVCYVNADVGGGDIKKMHELAVNKGFKLLLPDMKAGLSMDDVVNNLVGMNQLNADYSRYVFFFDTLKKMTDVICKSRSRDLYKVLRGLSAKGMTIVLLAHTNKYTDIDGKPIYEGTGDLKSDVDDLIYFIPKENPDGSMTVSTDPDKRRGTHRPITFEIASDLTVTRTGYIDTASQIQADKQRDKDQIVIEAITESLLAGSYKQIDIVDHCKNTHGIGWRSVEKVLKRYSHAPGKLWNRQRAFENNAWLFKLEGQP